MPRLLRTSLLALSLAACASPPGERPDIVFILADDLGYADVGFTGGTETRTPNLDSLAASGAVLRQFYVQAECSPTRAALMTGRYPMRYGLQAGVIRPWADYGLPLTERLLPQALRSAGYATALVGKWHLGSFDRAYWPTERGFDHHYGGLLGAIDHYSHARDGQLDWYRDGEPIREEGYSTHLLAREAVRTIEGQPRNHPLFLMVAFNAVHAPYQVPDRYTAPYSKLAPSRRTYAGMVAALDEAVGQIVEAIERSGRRDNTLLIFASDNGGPDPGLVSGANPLRGGKGSLYEGGLRSCALVSWRGHLSPGSAVDEPLHAVDWYPTLRKLAGVSDAEGAPLDGLNVWPTIVAGAKSPHSELLLNAAPHTGGIRVADWKLVINGQLLDIEDADGERLELFHLPEDPEETTNLASAQPDRTAELLAHYRAFASQAAPALGSERRPEAATKTNGDG